MVVFFWIQPDQYTDLVSGLLVEPTAVGSTTTISIMIFSLQLDQWSIVYFFYLYQVSYTTRSVGSTNNQSPSWKEDVTQNPPKVEENFD